MSESTGGCDKGTLRLLSAEDVPAAFRLSEAAGWNQTEEDWMLLLEVAPESCWAMEVDRQLAATTTLICYERRLAWVGMVLTKLEYRRRGFARELLAKTLSKADELGIETIKLDATEEGKSLYEEFGFHSEQGVERWSRPGGNIAQLPEHTAKGVWRGADLPTFGADRTHLLEKLAQRNPPMEHSESYLFFRPGRVTAHLGPCVSEDARTARRLIEQCLQDTGYGWSWDLLPQNQDAVALARDFGFTPQRHLLRMTRGMALPQRENAIYALAGFELG